MTNLIAYIPSLNSQYLRWLEKHEEFCLYLVSQEMAESLIPRLARNVGALAIEETLDLLYGIRNIRFPAGSLNVFHPDGMYPDFSRQDQKNWVMPDEDLSHLVAKKYLYPAGCLVEFQPVWGRWDMSAVKRQEPVIPDLEVSTREIDQLRMEAARKLGRKSPDWWRQIGAIVFRGEELLACAFNAHFPNEYEVAIFGDPRINFDAGDPAGAEVYLSLHAERGTICFCSRKGIALEGASLYVTEFPCPDCTRWIVAAGFKEVFFSGGYSMLGGLRTLQAAGVRIVKVKAPESA